MICRAGSQQRRDAKFFSGNLNHSHSNLPGTNHDRYRCEVMAQNVDRRLEELKREIAEQESLVRRMIVRGTPSQGAEDRLRDLEQQLAQIGREASHSDNHATGTDTSFAAQ